MSIAVAIRGAALDWKKDYQPATADSHYLQDVWRRERNYLSGTASNWISTIDAALSAIRGDCSLNNWDGEGAIAISEKTIELAVQIAHALFFMLPKGMPAPDAVPEADGEVGFSWIVDESHLFGLSIGPEGKINFAGQFGKEGGIHGWKSIDLENRRTFEKSMEDVVQHIGRLYPAIANQGIS